MGIGPCYVKVATMPGHSTSTAYVRQTRSEKGVTVWGPKIASHPSVGILCVACGQPLEVGSVTVLIPVGPGSSLEQQEKCRKGVSYNAVAKEVHFTCATGVSVDEDLLSSLETYNSSEEELS